MAFLNERGLEYLLTRILAKFSSKVDKVNGKGLSTNDYTDEDKKKLNTQSDWTQADETQLDFIKNKPNEDNALEALAETGFITPTTTASGAVFTDSNGILYTL